MFFAKCRYGNDPSNPRLCQLGKYKRDTKNYKAGSHKTFVPLLVRVSN